jgi:hypothetical protein
MQAEQLPAPVHCVTRGPLHHFFGYYDKFPWDPAGRHLLSLESSFMDRNPMDGEPVTVGWVDPEAGDGYVPLAESRAWNWQQGCMLRWWPGMADTVVYNDREHDRYVSRRLDLAAGTPEVAGPALYDLSVDGRWGATLTFERVSDCRPGYGYFGPPDPRGDSLQPDDDGLYCVDMKRGKSELIQSIRGAAEIGEVRPGPGDRAWFNHLTFNPSGARILFLHRWARGACPGHEGFQTRVMTIGRDGSGLRCLTEGYRASHFHWLNDETVLFFLYHPDGDGYYLVDEGTGSLERVGEEVLPVIDGHCLYRPQRDWLVTDTYPQGPERIQTLLLFHPATGRLVEAGAFPALEPNDPSQRCDLHTRWNHSGTQLCFDSTHEGSRQMYVMDVSEIVGR